MRAARQWPGPQLNHKTASPPALTPAGQQLALPACPALARPGRGEAWTGRGGGGAWARPEGVAGLAGLEDHV